MDLLNGEIVFNKDLGSILERLQAIQQTLELVQTATFDDRLGEAVESLGKTDGYIKALSLTKSTRISGVLDAKVTDMRNHIKERLIDHWHRHIIIDPARSSIGVRRKAAGTKPRSSLCVGRVLIYR